MVKLAKKKLFRRWRTGSLQKHAFDWRFRVMGSFVFDFEQVITATIKPSMLLDASVFRSNIEVPVDHTIITISLLEPFICLGKVATVKLEVWSDYSCSVP